MKRKSTKDVIADTVFDLLQSQKIWEITIAQITEDADISTRTFYNHFKDKYDVSNYIYNRMLEKDCWYIDGKRCDLNTFFSNVLTCLSGTYQNYFSNILGYTGQNSIHAQIVSQGVKDLTDQLKYTGHAELITPETIDLLEFFMYGMDSFFTTGMNTKSKKHRLQYLLTITRFLPHDLYEALTAEPIYAPEKSSGKRNKRNATASLFETNASVKKKQTDKNHS